MQDNSADAQLANSHEQQDVDKKQQNQDKKKDKKKKDKKKNDNSDDEPAAEAWYLPPLDPKFAAGLTRDYAAPRGSPVAGAGGAGYNPFVGSAASPFYYNRASTGYPYYAYGYPSQPVAAVPGSTAGYSNV